MIYNLELKHHFDAAHKLVGYEGACANVHGHRWEVIINIEGEKLNEIGILIDFKDIKKIIDQLDHCYINDKVKFNPTAENLAQAIYDKIDKYCEGLSNEPLVNYVEVFESPGASIKYTKYRQNGK